MSDDNQQIPPAEIPTGQPARQSSFEDQRSRGGCLTTIVVLFTILSLRSMYSIFNSLIHPISAFDRSLFPFINLLLIAVHLVSFYGIWTWKKWGIKLFITSYILYILLIIIVEITVHSYDTLFQGRFLVVGIIIVTIGLALAILFFGFFYFEVKKRWQYFS